MKAQPHFKGCFYKEDINVRFKLLRKGESIVINLDNKNSGRGGTHWTMLKKSEDDKSYIYFDSFGMPCPEEVKTLVKKKRMVWNSSQFQDTNSILCGYYCVYVLQKLYDGKSFYDVLYSLSLNIGNTQANERFISNFGVKKYINI